MTDAKNALAELAERLRRYADFDIDDANYPDLDKTQRIIEKLASRYEPCFPAKSGDDVIDECRAIAEKARFAMASREYTAQEMREMADCAEKGENCKDLAAMLRQAADAEEENAQLKAQMKAVSDELSFTQDAYAKATARLEAVVKECETEKSKWIPAMEYESVVKRSSMVDRYDRILRAARGEGGAE